MNKQEFMACYDEASRRLNSEIDDLKEKLSETDAFRRVLDAARDAFAQTEKLKDELEQKQQEIDDLEEQLDRKDAEIADWRQQLLEAQNANLEAQNANLASEKQQLEAEVKAKPAEIHNYFEQGCSAQVFNDKVTGKFIKQKKQNKQKKKEKKSRWKKMLGKVS